MSSKAKQPGQLVRRPPASGREPSRRLKAGDIATIGDDLVAFQRQYHSVSKRREQRHCSMFYLCGRLSGPERKTIEPMILALHGPHLNARHHGAGKDHRHGDHPGDVLCPAKAKS